MGITWAEQQLEIDATAEVCFAAIVDFETYPDWQQAVLDTEVLDRYQDGLGRRVRLKVDAKLRTVTYVLHYHYDRPWKLWWDFVEGEGVKHIEGEYLFEALNGGTRATYKLGVDVGIPVPGPIARKLNQEVMRRSIDDLKARAEGLAAG